MVDRLDTRAVERISGAAWDSLRQSFFQISEILLSASPTASSELTTIYVKFCAGADVYAVVWIKTAKQIVVGLSLPEEVQSPTFVPAPKGTTYRGLTKHFVIENGTPIPDQLGEWARLAFVTASQRGEPAVPPEV